MLVHVLCHSPDVDEFKLPKNVWKLFGNGMCGCIGCIGCPFVWQEALLMVAILLQNFNFQMHNSSYDLQIKQTLTIKLKDLYMRATPREGLDVVKLSTFLSGSNAPETSGAGSRDCKAKAVPPLGETKPMHVFYGRNTGTCEAFACRLADDALGYGYSAEVKLFDFVRIFTLQDGGRSGSRRGNGARMLRMLMRGLLWRGSLRG